ncbi:MAG: hypothetical protein GF329_12640, partial [Candidatus Lokiarchaeota archaeon]|nr:hypothetical protein [Candidatus Lokiarchaeota archaeon]
VLNGSKNHVVVSAPNGYGKTILSLASILPIIKEKKKKLIYLCRTHTQITRVINELEKINTKIKNNDELAIDIGGFGLRGRSSMCFHPAVLKLKDPSSSHITCRELRKNNRCQFFNNINRKTDRVDFLLSILQINPMDGSNLIELCRDYSLCPYMIGKLALARVDVVACNYQWILNPFIRNSFLETLDTSLKDIILVIDEAHNIPDVATEIASFRLTKFGVKAFIDEVIEFNQKQYLPFGKRVLEIFNKFIDKNFEERAIIPDYIIKNLRLECNISIQFFEKMIEKGEDIRKIKLKRKKTPSSSIFSMGVFWLNWLTKMKKESYFFSATKYFTRTKKENLKLEIISLDPRDILQEIFSDIEGSLHMSGTIKPITYVDTIGLPEITTRISLPSLWGENNLRVLAIKGLTSRGKMRSKRMYKEMIKQMKVAIKHTPKNIGIFAASYDILNGLLDAGFKSIKTKKTLFIEKPRMNSEENDIMIRKFKNESKKQGAVLLGVCGGRNAEGEDFPGDFMNTVVVCGIPFARPTIKVQAKIDYYVKLWGKKKGKDMAYNSPALRRANQAAGRPVRTLNDRGIIILMDYRYTTSYFSRFLSKWLKDNIKVLENNPKELEKELLLFYGSE